MMSMIVNILNIYQVYLIVLQGQFRDRLQKQYTHILYRHLKLMISFTTRDY